MYSTLVSGRPVGPAIARLMMSYLASNGSRSRANGPADENHLVHHRHHAWSAWVYQKKYSPQEIVAPAKLGDMPW